MSEITEIFVMKMKDADRAVPIRERARQAYLAIDGVSSWRSYQSTDTEKPTLFAEVYTYESREAADKATPNFAQLPETQAFLGEVAEMIVGQYFVEIGEQS